MQAQLALGTVYNNIYKDYPKAAEFWKVEKDIRKKKQAYAIGAHGIKLLEMALKNGNYKAAYLLYGVYAFGWGARVNEKLGREYLVMAARGGCEGAIEHCRKFNKKY